MSPLGYLGGYQVSGHIRHPSSVRISSVPHRVGYLMFDLRNLDPRRVLVELIGICEVLGSPRRRVCPIR